MNYLPQYCRQCGQYLMPGYHCPNCRPMPLKSAKNHYVSAIGNSVLDYLTHYSRIPRWIIVSENRSQKIAYTRMAGLVICGKIGLTQGAIGEIFDRHRTTIIHAQKMYLNFENDKSLDELTNYFVSLIDSYDYAKHDPK